MTGKPTALRLADALEQQFPIGTAQHYLDGEAAAELRRLHELLKEWKAKAATWLASPEAAQRLEGYRELAQRLEKAEAQRDELLAALNAMLTHMGMDEDEWNKLTFEQARAAIQRAEGSQK